MTTRARQMQASGIDVISFAAGEPDFNTPQPIAEAAIQAIRDGQTKYCASKGLPGLGDAVVAKLARENGITATSDQIVVSCGAKHSLYNALQILVGPGDEVLLFAPYWMTYFDQVVLAGAEPVIVRCQEAGRLIPTREEIEEAITPRTRAVVLNSPSNPTGATWTRSQIEDLAQIAERHDLWVISDEIYERLIYGVTHTSIASLSPELADRTVTITGVSKTFAMTGWRIGFACAPVPVAKAMANLQDQVTSNATTFAQFGAIAALKLPDAEVEHMRAEFQARRDLMAQGLLAIPGVKLVQPTGAFYHFPDVSGLLGPDSDVELAEALLEHAHIACVPGSVFEGPGHLRFSYAASRADIGRGMERMATFLSQRTA